MSSSERGGPFVRVGCQHTVTGTRAAAAVVLPKLLSKKSTCCDTKTTVKNAAENLTRTYKINLMFGF